MCAKDYNKWCKVNEMNKVLKDKYGVIGVSTNDILVKHLINSCSQREVELMTIFQEFSGARIAKFCKEFASERDKAILPVIQDLCDKHGLSVLLEDVVTEQGYECDGHYLWVNK